MNSMSIHKHHDFFHVYADGRRMLITFYDHAVLLHNPHATNVEVTFDNYSIPRGCFSTTVQGPAHLVAQVGASHFERVEGDIEEIIKSMKPARELSVLDLFHEIQKKVKARGK